MTSNPSSKVSDLQQALTQMDIEIAGIPAWLWIAIPALFTGCYVLARFAAGTLVLLARAIGSEKSWVQKYVLGASHPVALLLAGILFKGSQKLLPLQGETKAALSYFNTTVYVFALAWLIIIYISNGCDAVQERLLREKRHSAAALMPLLRKITKISVILLAFLFLLQNWGFDVAALITALGVGGIAVALASQKSMENLFGGIMISLDQPVRIGDVGKFGKYTGTVEDIGLRSTRVRTVDRTILTIPNAEMATMQIENVSARDKFLFQKNLDLSTSTAPQQLRKILEELSNMIASGLYVEGDSARVRFIDSAGGIHRIELYAYIAAKDYAKFLEVQESLLLSAKEIVENEGASFASPPSSTPAAA